MAQRVARDLAQGARQLDAGGPATDDHEGHPGLPGIGIGLTLGALEGQQDAPPDRQRVIDGLEARREGLPVVVAEPAVPGAGRHDEAVVGDGSAVRKLDRARGRVQVDRFAQQDLGVRLVPEQ